MSETAWQFEHSIECNADRAFVWSFWTDVSNWERLEGDSVDWIKLDGPFAEGTPGATKTPGQDPLNWKIAQVDPERSATIEMPLDGAVFFNVMTLESVSANRTRITQRMSLAGEKASDIAKGMEMFETTAPQGLAKLAKTIESAFKNTYK